MSSNKSTTSWPESLGFCSFFFPCSACYSIFINFQLPLLCFVITFNTSILFSFCVALPSIWDKAAVSGTCTLGTSRHFSKHQTKDGQKTRLVLLNHFMTCILASCIYLDKYTIFMHQNFSKIPHQVVQPTLECVAAFLHTTNWSTCGSALRFYCHPLVWACHSMRKSHWKGRVWIAWNPN